MKNHSDLALLETFLDYLKIEKRYSPLTLNSYQSDIKQFLYYLGSHSETLTLLTATSVDIQRFSAQLNTQNQKPATIKRKLSSLKSFYQWLLKESLIPANPVNNIRTPKLQRTLPGIFDIETLDYLLSLPQNTPIESRDKAIMELFYSSGLRLSELVNLDIEALDLDEKLVTVTGKGNKSRILPVGSKAISAIKSWLEHRPIWLKDICPALFLSNRGTRLSQRSVQLRLKHWQQLAGLPQSLHPHKLRHSFASHMLESSSNLRAVQELLGHKDISTTQIYTHLDYQHLANIYDKSHPKARKKSSSE